MPSPPTAPLTASPCRRAPPAPCAPCLTPGTRWSRSRARPRTAFASWAAELKDDGLEVVSVGYSPALGAIAVKAAIAALQGEPLPQLMSIPVPVAYSDGLQDGLNFWSDLDDNFFTPNEFPPCNVNFTAEQIMTQNLD